MAATHGRLTGRAGRLPRDARPRRAQPDDRRRLRAARRHADGHDHRPEGDPEPQAGALSGRRHRLDHDAADQDGASDRQSGDHSVDGARGVPGGAAGAARTGSSRTAGGHRRTRRAPDMSPVPPHPIDPPVAQRAALDRAAELILEAERPLVMLGAAASRPRLADALSEFVRRVQIPFFNTQMGKGAVTGGSGLYMGTAALSERDYVHRAIDRADLIISIGHDTVEKPPFFMGPEGPTVLHVGYLPGDGRGGVLSRMPSSIGDVGPSLTLLADRLEGKLPKAGALLRLARRDPRAHRRPGGGKPLPADAAADRARRAPGDAGRRHRLPRQRHVQDLVRPQLPHPRREHAAARQRARDHGRRTALGDDGRHALSEPPRAGGLRRRRVHDELAGAGDGGAPQAQSRGADRCRTTPTE